MARKKKSDADRLAEEGNTLMRQRDWAGAEAVFRRGLELVADPGKASSARLWFLCGIGDAQWQAGRHEEGRDTWRDALLFGGLGNPFVHLRRGQVEYELGDQREAANELLRAMLLAGDGIFATEDSKHRALVVSEAQPPAGMANWDGFGGVEPGSPVHDWLMDPGAYTIRAKAHRPEAE